MMTRISKDLRLVWLLIGATVASFAPIRSLHADEPNGQYATLAEALASPVFFDIEQAKKGHTDTAVMLRMEIARQQLMGLRSLPFHLAGIRSSSLEGLDACHSSMANLRQLNNYMPDFEGVAKRALDAAPGVLKAANKEELSNTDKNAIGGLAVKAGAEIIGGLVNAYQASRERDAYRKAYVTTRVEAVRAISKACATQYQGTKKVIGNSLEIVFNGSWNNSFTRDWLCLRNDTGRDLSNCTILVNLNGYSAQSGNRESDSHLHYVAKWPAGKWIYAPYPSKANDGIATDESADSVESVSVSYFSDQGWDRLTHTYHGPNYDKDVKRYFETMLKPRFKGSWYHYDNHVFYDNGFQFSYDGDLSYFPVSYITVTAKQGLRVTTMKWTINGGKMSRGSNMWLSHLDFNGMNRPETIDVYFEFPRSSYTHTVTWHFQ